MTPDAQRRDAYRRRRLQYGLTLETINGVDPNSQVHAGRIPTYHQIVREMENAKAKPATSIAPLRKGVKRRRLLLPRVRRRLVAARRSSGVPQTC